MKVKESIVFLKVNTYFVVVMYDLVLKYKIVIFLRRFFSFITLLIKHTVCKAV